MPYPGITFRPITDADLQILFQVYASTRLEELSVVQWTHQELTQFLNMQFKTQHQYYMEHYKGDSFELILLNDQPIGRLYVGRWKSQIRIIDIALLPEYQKQGIGGTIMKDLLAEGEKTSRKVSIHVEKNNPALKLYERLGFQIADDANVYHYMEWHPPGKESQ